jgi:CobQ-like glutamine amidotransferase family enzyme
VSKVIQLAAISPEHLNLNGDLGNLLVLKKRLALRGVESEISFLSGHESLQNFDLVLIGHGSKAAWVQLLSNCSELIDNVVTYVKGNGAILAVASAMDILKPALTGVEVVIGNWTSEFVADGTTVGYLNSSSKGPLVQWYQNALLTQLHGPILAKNPLLADEIISRNGWTDIAVTLPALDELDALAEQSRRIAFEH